MFKWLLIIAGIYLLYRWIKGKKQTQASDADSVKPKPEKAKMAAEPEAMVLCQHCKIHLPQSDAIVSIGGFTVARSIAMGLIKRDGLVLQIGNLHPIKMLDQEILSQIWL